jgi:hypothetical protein
MIVALGLLTSVFQGISALAITIGTHVHTNDTLALSGQDYLGQP